MHKPFITTAALLGLLAVMLGAFGAHGLKPHLTPDQMEIYQTANRYHFIHVLALLFTAILWRGDNKLLTYSGIAFIVGIVLFSGSIYLLATRELLGIESLTPILGPITPLGGLFFMAGWLLLALGARKI